ncbi:glycosyltransferase family 9 protein [Hufsiella ginkgonis]|uniref:LPS biosynthesis glycosyltransferase n=1 Tax=Hufsiella ginkgonis TaxID=2695274 RepID=A0A7K1Y1W8_9SPHI|nr:glycosyltransferase family 9 protein [Hufsiella ginkgonis]MXV16676.1 LPS biosynthesis glycosyltransferase [Hufsiella ginkgonis]
MKLLPENIQKIGILRALQLGDLLCAVPALKALRAAYPGAEITLFGLSWAESFVQRFSGYIDRFVHFPGYTGLPEQTVAEGETFAFIEQARKDRYDLIIQMQGDGTIVNYLVGMMESTYCAGFFIPEDGCPDHDLFLEYPRGIHETERHLRLMSFLGIPAESYKMEFPLNAADEKDFSMLEIVVAPGRYVIVHPGSRGPWRQWPPVHFAALADICAAEGFEILLTGTESEQAIVQEVQSLMKSPAINLAGKTGLGALGILVRDAYALISNCTGISHMAAALEVPGIVISMDGEPERWAPLNKKLHYTHDWANNKDLDEVKRQTQRLFL